MILYNNTEDFITQTIELRFWIKEERSKVQNIVHKIIFDHKGVYYKLAKKFNYLT